MIGAVVGGVALFLVWNNNFNVLIGIGVVYLLLCGLIFTKQNSLLYMPIIPGTEQSPSANPANYRHPKQMGLLSENIHLFTSDAVRLQGWLIKVDSPRVIVYFHQNAGNIGFRIPLLRQMSQRTHSNVLLIAYRGFSDSQGQPSEKGLQKDAEAILSYACEHFTKVYIYGRSLGGAVAVYAAHLNKFPIKGMILENTFINISEMVDAVMPFLKYFKWVNRNYWPSLQRIAQVRIPILFIRCVKDEIVPTNHMIQLKLHAKISPFVVEHVIQEGTHNVSYEFNPSAYFQQFNSFFHSTDNYK